MPYHLNMVFAFIDSQNLNLGVRSLGWELDFRKFRVYLKDKYGVSKAYLFLGYISSNKRLYKYLESAGYELVFKPVVSVKQGKKKIKGDIDAELVMHAMLNINNYEKALIVSGDGDFYCLTELLESRDKLLSIITSNRQYSSLLRKFGYKVVSLEKLERKIGKK